MHKNRINRAHKFHASTGLFSPPLRFLINEVRFNGIISHFRSATTPYSQNIQGSYRYHYTRFECMYLLNSEPSCELRKTYLHDFNRKNRNVVLFFLLSLSCQVTQLRPFTLSAEYIGGICLCFPTKNESLFLFLHLLVQQHFSMISPIHPVYPSISHNMTLHILYLYLSTNHKLL